MIIASIFVVNGFGKGIYDPYVFHIPVKGRPAGHVQKRSYVHLPIV